MDLKQVKDIVSLLQTLVNNKIQEEELAYPLGGVLDSSRESVLALDKLLRQHNRQSSITKDEVETLIVHWKRLSGSFNRVKFVHSGGSAYCEFNMTFLKVTDLEELFKNWSDDDFNVHTLMTNPYTIELEPNR